MVLLTVPVQLVFRRWEPPPGTFTVVLGLVILLFVGVDEFAQAPMVVIGVLAGATIDIVSGGVTAWLACAAGMIVLWVTYFAVYELTGGGVSWSAELWTGSVVLAGLVAGCVGLLTAPLTAGDGRHGVVTLY